MSAEFESDPDFDKVFLERAKKAAERWTVRKEAREERTKALQENRLFEADSQSRLALRLNRLVNDVRLSSRDRRPPDNPTLRRLVERTTPIVAEDLNEELIQEVVLGARDFLSIEFLERGIRAARPIGRILIQSGGSIRPRGTGFLVAPGLVITNEHVLRSKEQAAACSIQMGYEQRFGPQIQPQVFKFEPERFFTNNDKLDFAVVAVAPRSALGANIESYGWLPLIAAQGKIAITPKDYLNIIQHPLGREKEIVLRENRLLDLATREGDEAQLGPFLHYEGDTEKGSSGSPVLNDQWDVVALHHSGVPKTDARGRWLNKKDEIWKEGTHPAADIAWIANEGIRVSSLIAELSKAAVQPHERPLLAQLLASQAPAEAAPARIRNEAAEEPSEPRRPRPTPATRTPRAQETPPPSSSKTGTLTFDVPLRLTVSFADAPPAAFVPIPAKVGKARAELLEEALNVEDYADRDGYDRRFLGVKVPLPTIKQTPKFGSLLRVPRPARPADRFELPYHRFSVLMNKERRLAYVSACNLNFDPPATVSRDEGSQSWRRDPRLDAGHQLGAPYYDDNDYDKGHLTRRDDAAWGEDKDAALAANWDTFHYTNAAPQHLLFNRSDEFTGEGLDLWGDLENHISAQGTAQRARLCVFSGPVFGPNDKPLSDALAPRAFFKIVIWRDGAQDPGALGFVLDQSELIDDLPEEAIEPGRFVVRQKRIRQIESKLDIAFGVIGDWDQMGPPDPNESLDDDGIVLTSLNDVRGAKPK